jgi:hypothetical protein
MIPFLPLFWYNQISADRGDQRAIFAHSFINTAPSFSTDAIQVTPIPPSQAK